MKKPRLEAVVLKSSSDLAPRLNPDSPAHEHRGPRPDILALVLPITRDERTGRTMVLLGPVVRLIREPVVTPATQKPKKKLTVAQQKALEVLLVGGTDQAAADRCGASRSNVTKWRNNPASPFAEELERAREEIRRRQSARLQAAGALAVRALEEGVKDTRSPAARITAARTILDQGHKASASKGDEIQAPVVERRDTGTSEAVMTDTELLSLLSHIARTGKAAEQLRAAELLGRQLGMFREGSNPGGDVYPRGLVVLPAETPDE